MSMMVAPDLMKSRMVVVRAERSVGLCLPPSEKESGVRFRMAMMWVARVGFVGYNGVKYGEIGVMAKGVGVSGGRELK